MSRPWQVWLAYTTGFAVVVAAFGWLTVKALELDRAEALARRQTELEEDISRALWRMDSVLTPLLAEEAARPQFVYATFSPALSNGPGKSGGQALTPLLSDAPQYVLLHFEVFPDDRINSPQCPSGEDLSRALAAGASSELIQAAASRLERLKPTLSYSALLQQLPLPALSTDLSALPRDKAEAGADRYSGATVIGNTYENLSRWFSSPAADASGPAGGFSQAAVPAKSEPTEPTPAEDGQRGGQQPLAPTEQQAQQLDESQLFSGPNVESGRLQRTQSRAGNDLINREAALQAYAQKSAAEQRSNYPDAPALRAMEGVSRPLWVGGNLLLARSVQVEGRTIIQGCWLDWELLKERLRAEVTDLLPQVDLTPVAATAPIKVSRLLATIPVQLSAPPPAPPAVEWSPIRVSLVVAWGSLAMSALAAAIMLSSVIVLSERRGAFVSAVTHELRTPLTTFRMYSEMLSSGMVPDAAQQQKYLNTLRVEADRLAHLVENVLQYARLERGRPGNRREAVSIGDLVDRCRSRLAERAAQAGMQLQVESADDVSAVSVCTDPAAVEQVLFNLVDNACKYANHSLDKRLHLAVCQSRQGVRISVRDHGPGISAVGRRRLFQPFSKSVDEAAHSAPGVGLGLALSRRLAADLGGQLELATPEGGGAEFVLSLPR